MVTQVEIELTGRIDGRTFDERKLEFEVGEGLNVNIPRSDLIQFFSILSSLFCLINHRRRICQDDAMISGELNLLWRR